MRDLRHQLFAYLLLGTVQISLYAQSSELKRASEDTSQANDDREYQLEQRLKTLSSDLEMTEQQLQISQRQIRELQNELLEVKKQLAEGSTLTSPSAGSADAAEMARKTTADIEDLKERQQTVEAEVKVHEQIKVESSSKYPLKFNGLILFNAFENRGNVDNIDQPAIALQPTNSSGHVSSGASLRQTILGIEGFGPKIAGAQTSADVNLDFFGGLVTGNIGTSAGVIRMRTASINMNWERDSIQLGIVGPLISPLSPTSYARVAEAPMAGAGNLWTWSPQLRFAHQIPLRNNDHFQIEFGLWDPPIANYNSTSMIRLAGPGEQSGQPGYETRLSYGSSDTERGLRLGVSGYYSRQRYPYKNNLDSWAGTFDWRIPLSQHFEVSGEGYRGRALGGLGGGGYKDVLVGTNSAGQLYYEGLNAIGGWAQFKTRFTRSIEANASIGQDNGYAEDFHEVVFPSTATIAQLLARNKMVTGNIIFKPKTYLILSPEYRRIWTWPIYGPSITADIFTFSAGYQF